MHIFVCLFLFSSIFLLFFCGCAGVCGQAFYVSNFRFEPFFFLFTHFLVVVRLSWLVGSPLCRHRMMAYYINHHRPLPNRRMDVRNEMKIRSLWPSTRDAAWTVHTHFSGVKLLYATPKLFRTGMGATRKHVHDNHYHCACFLSVFMIRKQYQIIQLYPPSHYRATWTFILYNWLKSSWISGCLDSLNSYFWLTFKGWWLWI